MSSILKICKKCGKTDKNLECCGETIPYTGGQGYKRADGWWSWKFFINGNQRAKGTDRKSSIQDAINDFTEVFEYQPGNQEGRNNES